MIVFEFDQLPDRKQSGQTVSNLASPMACLTHVHTTRWRGKGKFPFPALSEDIFFQKSP